MESKSEYKRPDEPVGWQKFNLRVVKHPLVKRFKLTQRFRIMQVLSLACDWGNLGVIAQYDDEIADELEMPLSDWLVLRDKLLGHGIMREVRKEERKLYEISCVLLPLQMNDQRSVESFQEATWRQPQLPLDGAGAESSRVLDLIPASIVGEERRRLLGAARKAFCTKCATHRDQGLPEPDRDTFMWEYFIRRFPDFSTPAPDFSVSDAEDSAADGNASNGENGNAAGNGNAAPIRTKETDLDETDNNSGPVGNGNADGITSSVTVTGREDLLLFFSEEEIPSEQCDDLLVERIVSSLTGHGVTEIVAREELIPFFGLGACIDQLAYMPYSPPRDNPGGHLVEAIRRGYAPPPGYIKKREQQQAERNRKRRKAAQEAAQRQETEAAELAAARRAMFLLELSPEQQAEIETEIRESLRNENIGAYKRYEEAGFDIEKVGPIVRGAIDPRREKIIDARMKAIQGG